MGGTETTFVRLILRAFRYRNYRLFFFGQSVSLIGTWMQQVAMGWLVYRMTNSAFWLGVIGFTSQIPVVVLTPFAGVLADRYSRYKMVVIAQILCMAQALVLTWLVSTNRVELWHIIALSTVLGMVYSFEVPARQAFVIDMVEHKEMLANAIALNSLLFNGARFIGPLAAGLLIATVGESSCFFLNAVSYAVVIAALLMMKIVPRAERKKAHPHVLRELKEGVAYAYRFTPMRSILSLMALLSVFGFPYIILMPVITTKVLHGGPQVFGFLMAASGIGALCGALYLASRKSVLGFGRRIAIASGVFGFGLICFSFSQVLIISLALMFVTGLGMMVQIAASNTLLQTIVDDDKRGRIMSLYTLAFMGVVPFGSLLAGSLASKIGAPHTLLICGISCVAGAIMFALHLPVFRKAVRPVYMKMGIIPQVTKGIQSASELTRPPED